MAFREEVGPSQEDIVGQVRILDSIPACITERPLGVFKRRRLRSGAYVKKVILAAFWRTKSGGPITKFSPVQVRGNVEE